MRFPLHFRQHEFLPGSGGEGRYRGGLGVALDLVVETERPALANTAGEGTVHGAAGMLGGQTAHPTSTPSTPPAANPACCAPRKSASPSTPGDLFAVRSGGGGGWGPPEQRSPEARRLDEIAGLVAKVA